MSKEPYNPATFILGIYSKELKMYVHTKPHLWVLTEALFVTANTWRQPDAPLQVNGYVNCVTEDSGLLSITEKKQAFKP